MRAFASPARVTGVNDVQMSSTNAHMCLHNLYENAHDPLLTAFACNANAHICEHDAHEIHVHNICECERVRNAYIATVEM